MIEVTLYSREDCHLCAQAWSDLEGLQAVVPHRLKVVNVDSNPEFAKTYGSEVPVVEIGPYRLKAPITRQELQMTLSAAQDRANHIAALDNPDYASDAGWSKIWTKADTVSLWFARHYLAVLNLFVLIYVGLPFVAPVLMEAGIPGPALAIYKGYSLVCHQLAYRSFFLFGEQPVYPRAAAGVTGLLTFGQATGLSEGSNFDEIYAARDFIGNPQIGYKVGLCERDVAIYGGIFLFGILFALTGRRIPRLPWYFWILIGIVPIGLDGFSQLLSQPPFGLWAFRESPPLFRIVTGALFGVTTAWFGYPLVEETMAETRQIMERKWQRIKGG